MNTNDGMKVEARLRADRAALLKTLEAELQAHPEKTALARHIEILKQAQAREDFKAI